MNAYSLALKNKGVEPMCLNYLKNDSRGEVVITNLKIIELENSTIVIAKKIIEFSEGKLLTVSANNAGISNQVLRRDETQFDKTPSGILIMR